jgi:predicted DNA-binding protein
MKRTSGSQRQKQNQIRMSDDLKDRIRKYQKKLKSEGGLDVSFSSAVRALIEKGLEEVR